MIVAGSLLGYAALLLAAGPRLLVRARWPDSAPRLAIWAWFALTGTAVAAVLAGGLALVVPTGHVSSELAQLLAACVGALRSSYAHPGGAALSSAGALAVLAVAVRVGWCTVQAVIRARRERRRHRSRLALIGEPDHELGAVIVCHPQPAVYCLPGRQHNIVMTTGAIEALDPAQVAAVLAHERAHLRGRHHLLVMLAGALDAAFPRVSAFGIAARQIGMLAEFRADDAASSTASPQAIARALLDVGASAPTAALGAGGTGTDAAARVRRLIAAPTAITKARAAAVALTMIAATLLPLVLLAGPAVSARWRCPLEGARHTGAASGVMPGGWPGQSPSLGGPP